MKFSFFRIGLGALFVLLLSTSAFSDDKPIEVAEEPDNILMREVSIIGSKYNVKSIAGSAAFLDVEDIREHNVDDINRILRRVPGVNVREEDGFGLFPNISLRGVDSARSSKVTIMEDGILMAPAPYSAPSAYYMPTTGRMSGIEVLKGSSQVKFGPHTTGGAINFLSTPIPTTERIYSKSSWGQFNEIRNHSYFGGTEQLDSGGRFGYVIEYYTRSNAGFKVMDTNPPDLRGEPDTGFNKKEPMIKMFWEPKTANYQRIEAKFGYTILDANETYVGVSNGDFVNSPFRRYAGTRFDEIESTQFRNYIRHFLEFNNDTNLVTTVYGNTFNRNWQKIADVNGNSISTALANQGGADFACLRGENSANCTLRLRNNNRTYYMYGIQSNLNHKTQIGNTKHEIEFGVRYHYDQIRRKQWDETFTQRPGGAIDSVAVAARGDDGNRTQQTGAIALHAQDAIKYGKFTFTPGIRMEFIDAEYWDQSSAGVVTNGKSNYDVTVGGGSLKYDVYDVDGRNLDIFGGVYRGFSPVAPRSGIVDNLTEETSVGFEVGTRYANAQKAFSMEAIFFHTEIDDLIIPNSIGGGGTSSTVNAGEVRSMGVELQVNYDRGLHKGWSVQTPNYVSVTYTDAEFQTDVGSGDQESIFAGAKKGNQLPYIPELVVSFGTGAIYKKWSANIDANFVTAAYADGANTSSSGNPATGEADARFGKIDSRLVVDAALGYQWSDKVRMFSNFRNITSQEYIVSRQPLGPRPGAPFSMMAGLEFSL